MELEKDQQIIVLTDFTENSKIAINHAIVLGRVLEKEITIACLNNSNESEIELNKKLKSFSGKTILNTYVLNGNTAIAFNEAVQNINAILVIVSFQNEEKKNPFSPQSLLKTFRKSRIPYLFVNKDINDEYFYKKIILPIDSTKEAKEKVLWASYFSRFNDSEIKVMTAHVKDEYFVRQLNNNQKFIRKIFNNFDVNFEIIKTMTKEKDIDMIAINKANEENAGLVIVITTKTYGLMDLIKGPKELFSITNNWKVPIMCLNPRDDLYVLCD